MLINFTYCDNNFAFIFFLFKFKAAKLSFQNHGKYLNDILQFIRRLAFQFDNVGYFLLEPLAIFI